MGHKITKNPSKLNSMPQKLQITAVAAAALLTSCSATPPTTQKEGSVGLEAVVSSSHTVAVAYTRQTPNVDATCFPKRLKKVLGAIHGKFGVKPMVTSGFRPRSGTSMHARCKAADIRVPGIKPSRVARYARSIEGIGGVGTYCRKGIVHVDVGPRRDWHHC